MGTLRLLITGATGLLGNNIARLAIAKGFDVTTLSRAKPDHPAIRDLPVRHVQSDLNDPRLLERLEQVEVDCVIHSAALVHIGWTRVEDSLKVNEQGTLDIVRWASQRGTRGVHISTVNVLPVGEADRIIREDSLGDGQLPSAYVLSKRAAQKVVDQAIEEGADWYSVYPGFMLGPYDWQLSSGKMIQPLQRFMPWAPAGGCSVCDPRDVGAAILKIAEEGARDRNYILAGDNVTYLTLWTEIAKALGTRPPILAMRMPAKVISQVAADVINTVRRVEGTFNSAAIEMGQQFHYYNSDRAFKQLGYRTRDIQESIHDAVEWLANQGQLEKYRKRLKV